MIHKRKKLKISLKFGSCGSFDLYFENMKTQFVGLFNKNHLILISYNRIIEI